MGRNTYSLVALCLLLHCVFAYDTGHHNDVTRNALQLFGYNQYAQDIGGIANFFVDYYGFTPADSPEYLPELMAMHFDNIFTIQNATAYWSQFIINARSAVQEAVRANDTLGFIMTLGGTLHTVQDFYAHSSWVEIHHRTECGCYRDETFIGALHNAGGDIYRLVPELTPLHTYSYGECDEFSRNCLPGQIPHGDACGGINKDSYVRPLWEQSYTFAFVASMEWIHNVHRWASEVDADILTSAQSYVPPQEDVENLEDLKDWVRTVSYAIEVRGNDGHWKGTGSGSSKRFVESTLQFTASKSIYKEKFLSEKIYLQWVLPNPYDSADMVINNLATALTFTQPFSQISEGYQAIVVRTVSVNGEDSTINTPSFYARVVIDDLTFIESVEIDKTNFKPHWTSIKFVPLSTTQANIRYTLLEDEFPGDDDVVYITPLQGDGSEGDGDLIVTFNTNTNSISGDATGVHSTPATAFSVSNPDEKVTVSLFITTRRLGNCTDGLPNPFCPEEAYVSAGVHEFCYEEGGETIPDGPENAAPRLYGLCGLFVGLVAGVLFCL